MNNVFVVETPLQLLNAVEAQHTLALGGGSLVVLLTEPFPEESFRPLLRYAGWKRVEYLPIYHAFPPYRTGLLGRRVSGRVNEWRKEARQLAQRKRVDQFFRTVGEVDNLVLGNYLAAYMRHIANILHPRTLYVVDDGTDTLRVNSLRHEKGEGHAAPPRSLWRRGKLRFRTTHIDWDSRQAESVTFFSSYDLQVTAADRLIRNGYTFMRSRMGRVPAREEVYFLGQPLVEDGYLAQETYWHSLEQIAHYYRGADFIYLPHKRESAANVEKAEEMGLTVRRFALPIEVQMLREMPRELASFFSSALDNSRIIFAERLKVKAFMLEQSRFYPGHEFVQDFYDYFRSNAGPYFEVLPLEDIG